MTPAITADHLGKSYLVKVRTSGLSGAVRALVRPTYRDVRAVDDVSFTLDRGEIVGFLGPNGAGKTTTLKMLTGLLYPTSGRARVAGFEPWTGGAAFKQRIALVLGNKQQLLWDLPPEETFQLNQAIYNIPRSDIATLFPGYANTAGPVGFFSFDSTTLPNGVHTLYWIATDNLGRADGIGSRYITVLN